ncbi:MAG: hypothetical protein HQK88_15565 [Nitrospirae bacterium]|nr:hypothetical protein [Nitrospirota bacterium]MBF0536291.1 hypothetical protein [Nitrospirota bacterium]MBF0618219.1 hypothetical protein [Nitrospirota bacterium]
MTNKEKKYLPMQLTSLTKRLDSCLRRNDRKKAFTHLSFPPPSGNPLLITRNIDDIKPFSGMKSISIKKYLSEGDK